MTVSHFSSPGYSAHSSIRERAVIHWIPLAHSTICRTHRKAEKQTVRIRDSFVETDSDPVSSHPSTTASLVAADSFLAFQTLGELFSIELPYDRNNPNLASEYSMDIAFISLGEMESTFHQEACIMAGNNTEPFHKRNGSRVVLTVDIEEHLLGDDQRDDGNEKKGRIPEDRNGKRADRITVSNA